MALVNEINAMKKTQEELIAEISDLKLRLTHTLSKPEAQDRLPRPEDDPEWPTTMEALALRNKIRARYAKN